MPENLPTRIQLEVVTPDRQVVHESVDEVTLPGENGYLGVLPGHAPLLSEIRAGELEYAREGGHHYLSLSWGFAEVLPERVIVLAQTAERAEEIDVDRAQRAKQRADERLNRPNDPDLDMTRARAALARAMARLDAARRLRG
jgi:F-type H+-transporting ATPase subunit epsilon